MELLFKHGSSSAVVGNAVLHNLVHLKLLHCYHPACICDGVSFAFGFHVFPSALDEFSVHWQTCEDLFLALQCRHLWQVCRSLHQSSSDFTSWKWTRARGYSGNNHEWLEDSVAQISLDFEWHVVQIQLYFSTLTGLCLVSCKFQGPLINQSALAKVCFSEYLNSWATLDFETCLRTWWLVRMKWVLKHGPTLLFWGRLPAYTTCDWDCFSEI